jgi:hypothetical protein
MCKYTALTNNGDGRVRWCYDCKTYNVNFNNLIMSFTIQSFSSFKNNLVACYEENINRNCCRDERQILFNTQVEGMQLLFSTNEVGSFLSLMQEAELSLMVLEDNE